MAPLHRRGAAHGNGTRPRVRAQVSQRRHQLMLMLPWVALERRRSVNLRCDAMRWGGSVRGEGQGLDLGGGVRGPDPWGVRACARRPSVDSDETRQGGASPRIPTTGDRDIFCARRHPNPSAFCVAARFSKFIRRTSRYLRG